MNILNDLLYILAIVMVVEGIFPFLSPIRWKQFLLRMITLNNNSVRFMALISMILGAFLMGVIHPSF